MPARVSADLKRLRGTDQPCRSPQEAFSPLASTPAPPDFLSTAACVEWARIAPPAVAVGIAGADLRALALLAETLATESALRAVIEAEGVTIESGSGAQKAHPALNGLAQARQQAGNLLAAFGLTPKGRQALPSPTGTRKPWHVDGKNPFDAF